VQRLKGGNHPLSRQIRAIDRVARGENEVEFFI
jgi:hypothetical protein